MSYDFRAKNEFDDELLLEFLDWTVVNDVSIYCGAISAGVSDPIIKYHNTIEFVGNHGFVSLATKGFDTITIERIKDYYALTFITKSSNDHCVIKFECDENYIQEFFSDFDAELNAL